MKPRVVHLAARSIRNTPTSTEFGTSRVSLAVVAVAHTDCGKLRMHDQASALYN